MTPGPSAAAFAMLSPTTLADVLSREQVMDIGIRLICRPEGTRFFRSQSEKTKIKEGKVLL